jgi:hypothetical protein
VLVYPLGSIGQLTLYFSGCAACTFNHTQHLLGSLGRGVHFEKSRSAWLPYAPILLDGAAAQLPLPQWLEELQPAEAAAAARGEQHSEEWHLKAEGWYEWCDPLVSLSGCPVFSREGQGSGQGY